jgi:NitT/TauT family transport system permease protein
MTAPVASDVPEARQRAVEPGPGGAPTQKRGSSRRSKASTLFSRRRLVVLTSQLVLLTVIMAVWEFGSGYDGQSGKFLDQYTVSKPSEIWQALTSFEERGLLWSNILLTCRITLIGFAIGASSGFLAGLVLGLNRYLADVLSPFLGALYSTPRLALVPLFILWFGIGDGAKLALVASIVFFLVFYATFAGVKEVDVEVIDRMKLMRAGRVSIARKAILPSAASFIVEGLRVSGPFALVSAVTAEMLSSNQGMGFLLIRSSSQFDTPGVFACIVVLAIMGITLMGAIRLLESRLLRWKPEHINRNR